MGGWPREESFSDYTVLYDQMDVCSKSRFGKPDGKININLQNLFSIDEDVPNLVIADQSV